MFSNVRECAGKVLKLFLKDVWCIFNKKKKKGAQITIKILEFPSIHAHYQTMLNTCYVFLILLILICYDFYFFFFFFASYLDLRCTTCNDVLDAIEKTNKNYPRANCNKLTK